jgi:hypothetical protein
MARARLTAARLAELIVLPIHLAALTVAALRPLARLWAAMFDLARGPLGLAGRVALDPVRVAPFLTIDFPFLTTPASAPSPTQWAVVGILCAAALLASLVLPRSWIPLAYALRLATFVQITALLVFALPGNPFPYQLPQYLLGFLQIGSVLLALAPIVLGMVYFPFDIAWWRKVGLAVMIVAHGAVLLPLQLLLHAYLIHNLSLLVMPTLFLVFGVLVEIFAFVSFYGWGMSWEGRAG